MTKKAHKYIYSNKKHTQKGIFATILAVLSFLTLLLMIFISYMQKGEVKGSIGAVAFLCTLFSLTGIVLGSLGKKDPECFYLFSHIGIIWNIVDLFIVSSILYAGV